MTPSLPVPRDADPDQPDGGRVAPVVHLPRAVEIPPRPPLPPLPSVATSDLVIPPRPPLPTPRDRGEALVDAATDETDDPIEPELVDDTPEGVDEADSIDADADADADAVGADLHDGAPGESAGEDPDADDSEESTIAGDVVETLPETAEQPAELDHDGTVAGDETDPGPLATEPAGQEALAFVDIAAPLTAAEGDDDVLVLRSVVKSFGSTRAVDGIDLTVQAGSFYGIVGPNGAGKTTTLSMIAGLLSPDRGSIRVGGVDFAADPHAAKQMMGVLPDRLRTFDRLTGRQLLYYYGVLRGLRPAVVESRTADLARAFDLTEALGRVVSDYSAGMAKKVMLAGAMIHSPRLLVLDEPFEAVDPVSSAVILDILSTYVAHGGTVILSSHGMDLVERVCSRVAVIVAGQVLAEGSIEEVRGELTLEQRFVELAGGLSDVEGLEWLHTFSG
ncbi:ABC transporter ATP-binding protein [Microbacterium aurantiacum]|uniref:ABC transporter ATP-binding protein n=1 Tax=Microbacterium aurantiacum TaxID=162393 RepID=UPI001E3DBBD1|nr:ABC transporter ATP-binding protein [Microbacterium chocolatum]